MKRLFLLAAFCYSLSAVFAQSVIEATPAGNAAQQERFERERQWPERGQLRTTLTLPFFDDFGIVSTPTNDPSVPLDAQRWQENEVYINDDYPIDPLTRGVATFDGLDDDGFPDNFGANDLSLSSGSDTLTSLPIDLSAATDDDNIWLMFHYQARGRGNRPDAFDSLVVEFLDNNNQWIHRWSKVNAGLETDSFYRALLPVDSSVFYHAGFKMRFTNYATLAGDFDHWHLDWVYMGESFDTTASEIRYNDVAMRHRNWSFLRDYTAMPWTHYLSDPELFMADTFIAIQRNLYSSDQNIQTGYKVEYDNQTWDFPGQEFNTFGNSNRKIDRTIPLNDFQFDPLLNDTLAEFDVKVYIPPTAIADNDTARFRQIFSNYYAYDDGTAERAITMDSAPGGSLALKCKAEITDTLLGMLIHFTPYGNDPSNETFLLRIWGNGGGQPGDQIIENFNYHLPKYYDGRNQFVYYPFDGPIEVNGIFYCGLTQPGSNALNIGLDKNTNTIPTSLFFRATSADAWSNINIEGSIMLRPVFRSGRKIVSVDELKETVAYVAPNPVRDQLRIAFNKTNGNYDLRIYDLTGREVMRSQSRNAASTEWSMAELGQGMYIVRITDMESGAASSISIIKE